MSALRGLSLTLLLAAAIAAPPSAQGAGPEFPSGEFQFFGSPHGVIGWMNGVHVVINEPAPSAMFYEWSVEPGFPDPIIITPTGLNHVNMLPTVEGHHRIRLVLRRQDNNQVYATDTFDFVVKTEAYFDDNWKIEDLCFVSRIVWETDSSDGLTESWACGQVGVGTPHQVVEMAPGRLVLNASSSRYFGDPVPAFNWTSFPDIGIVQGEALQERTVEPGYYHICVRPDYQGRIGHARCIDFLVENRDPDGDGVPTGVDNCEWDWNPDQNDFDDDGAGDSCDWDGDNNGVGDWEQFEVFVIDTADGSENRLSSVPSGGAYGKDIRPDVTKAVYNHRGRFYEIDLDTKESVQLDLDGLGGDHAQYSADGRWLLFHSNWKWQQEACPSSPGAQHVYLANLATGAVSLTRCGAQFADWGPSDEWIVFTDNTDFSVRSRQLTSGIENVIVEETCSWYWDCAAVTAVGGTALTVADAYGGKLAATLNSNGQLAEDLTPVFPECRTRPIESADRTRVFCTALDRKSVLMEAPEFQPTVVVAAEAPGGVWTEGVDAEGRFLLVSKFMPRNSEDDDLDGVWNTLDNCRQVSNQKQSDLDQDSVGDACDPNLTVSDAISYIRDYVSGLGLARGPANSISAKLTGAANKFARDNYRAATNQLRALINQIRTFPSDALADGQKDELEAMLIRVITAISDGSARKAGNLPAEGPLSFALLGNYPNPFNPTTSVSFTLPSASKVRLLVFDLLGRHVSTLVDGTLEAGRHEALFTAGDLPTGTYLYRLTSEAGVASGSMVLQR